MTKPELPHVARVRVDYDGTLWVFRNGTWWYLSDKGWVRPASDARWVTDVSASVPNEFAPLNAAAERWVTARLGDDV